jgi:hypothetical protein
MNADARADSPKASIELFTSQGCSSCPPADKLLGELSRDNSIVAISLPIDIWDYLGWKDTLALKGHTKRQQAYAHARGDREVYTPQVIVNGMMQVAGSDRSAIDRAIEMTRRDGGSTLPLTLSVSGEKLTAEVPASKDGQGHGEVWLLPLTKTDTGRDRAWREQRPPHHLQQRGTALGQARRVVRPIRSLQSVDQGIPERRHRFRRRHRAEGRSDLARHDAWGRHHRSALTAARSSSHP